MPQRWVFGNKRVIELYIGSFDREFASRWHGISCIYGKIHNDLLDLATISLDALEDWMEPSPTGTAAPSESTDVASMRLGDE